MNSHKGHTAAKSPIQRGFLLLVVIGILAVLLTVCVGFLSYTRGEVMGVTAQRNKGDTGDVFHSAMDWTLSNICHDLMDSGGNMDPNKYCAFSINPGGNTGGPGWWFRPMQMGTCAFLPQPTTWNFPLQPAVQPGTEAPWAYLPADFFPGGGIRGRFSVQVFDVNACININDWNEDCNPSQCQMAHMVADAYGILNMENYRWYRDFGNSDWGYLPNCPLRYQEAWRVASHTARYMAWPDWNGSAVANTASHSWVTGNTSWLSMYGPQYSSLSATIQADGLPLYQTVPSANYLGSQLFCTVSTPDQNQYDRSGTRSGPWTGSLTGRYGANNPQSAGYMPWCMAGFVTQSGSDPDTGRCPININSCYNSGEILPFDYWNNPATYTMEGVWNVESLRRIIKVGWFYSGDPTRGVGGFLNAQTDWSSGPRGPLKPNEKMIVETLKLKLAYQYQETLCRYFTGSYAHQNPYQKFPAFFGSAIATYATAYPAATPSPANSCTVTDYSSPRFPVSLPQFRKHVHDDFLNALSKSYTNPSFAAPPPMSVSDADTTDGTVSFDISGNAEIAQGKLDVRTACACYDNMVPGKPADMTDFKGCTPYGPGDPIYELHVLQLARQEDMDDPYQIDPVAIRPGSNDDPRTLRKTLGASGTWPPTTPSMPTPTGPWPTSQWPGPAANNIYGRWVDNPNLSAVSYFVGQAYPDATAEVALYDHTGNCLTLLPKGNDICSVNAIAGGNVNIPLLTPAVFGGTMGGPLAGAPVPTGPWLDQDPSNPSNTCMRDRSGIGQHDVPWRQMCFSPDSFSTELTTTSTTFMLIINAQLVDGPSVIANPTNPAMHADQCWNQWGVVVEIAPDAMAESTASPGEPANTMMFPNPAIAPPMTGSFWQWCKNEMPRKTKTYQGTSPNGKADAMTDPKWLDDSWPDDTCPSLVTRNTNNSSRYDCPFGRTSFQCRMPWKSLGGFTPPLNGNAADLENSTATIVRDWKKSTNPAEVTTGCDIHQVPPAFVPSNRGADKIYDGPGGTNQTKKRIIIRSIWCLNEGIEM